MEKQTLNAINELKESDVIGFSRALRFMTIQYLDQLGKEEDNGLLVAGLERVFNLLDSLEDRRDAK